MRSRDPSTRSGSAPAVSDSGHARRRTAACGGLLVTLHGVPRIVGVAPRRRQPPARAVEMREDDDDLDEDDDIDDEDDDFDDDDDFEDDDLDDDDDDDDDAAEVEDDAEDEG